MKKIIASLAIFALLSPAHAQDGSEVTHAGDFLVRQFVDQNPTGTDRPSSNISTWHRFKWGVGFRANDQFSTKLTVLNVSQWGQSEYFTGGGGTMGGTNDTTRSTPNGTGNFENMLLVNEAYGTWMATDETLIRFGRGSFDMADGTVISSNDWQLFPNAFEGLLVTHDTEFARFSAWAVKFAEWSNTAATTSATGAHDPEANNYGFTFDLKSMPDFLKMVNVHVIQTSKDELVGNAGSNAQTGTPDLAVDMARSELRYGLTVAGDTAGLDYRATYAMQDGEFRSGTTKFDVEGSMIDAELGYSLPDVMNLRFGAVYHTDSGDPDSIADGKIETYDSYFYERHANAGFMDIMAWGNLSYVQVGATMTPMDDLNVGLQYLMFTATESKGAQNIMGDLATYKVTDKDDLGSEIDVWVEKKYEGGFSITGRYGSFTSGDALKTAAGKDLETISQFFVEGKMMF